jgi:predicted nucleic acid-binding protein
MPGALYLSDSNILLRLVKSDHPQYSIVREAIGSLELRGMRPAYTLQNMAEFWNASTRPKVRNGFGLTVEETERNALDVERSFTFLPDNEAVYREWRRVVVQCGISGVQVHDARLAAAMYAHGITDILTFNGQDFKRFAGITAIDPAQLVTSRP